MPATLYYPTSSTNFHLECHEVTIDDLDMKLSDFEKRSPRYGSGSDVLLLPITIKINEDLIISGDVYKINRDFGFTFYKVVKDFSMKYDLTIYDANNAVSEQVYGIRTYDTKGVDSSDLTKSSVNENLKTSYSTCVLRFEKPDDVVNIKGRITFKITLNMEIKIDPYVIESINWCSLVSKEAIENLKTDNNFTITCKGETFHFNKTLLCIVSDVFRTMIQGKLGQEAITGNVEIEDFTPDTIGAFKRICFENKDFEEGDSVPDLLLFAQKYFMSSLKQKCVKKLVSDLNPSNIYDAIKIADQIDDENFLKICARYMSMNKGKLEKNGDWAALKKSHPGSMIKLMDFMLFAE